MSNEQMQLAHDEQLRAMKERWNLLISLRKEKRTQKNPSLLPSTGVTGDGNISGSFEESASIGIAAAVPLGTGVGRRRKKKKTKVRGTSVVKGFRGSITKGSSTSSNNSSSKGVEVAATEVMREGTEGVVVDTAAGIKE